MAHPTLVHAYAKPHPSTSPSGHTHSHALPPISAFSFEALLRSVDGPEVQAAIEGIAEICAKNRMSLAEEYAAHMPPVGEIVGGVVVGTGSAGVGVGGGGGVGKVKPVVKRALTSVPEASLSGSEGSGRSRRRSIFELVGGKRKMKTKMEGVRVIRIGSMGMTVPAASTTAVSCAFDQPTVAAKIGDSATRPRRRVTSAASTSLQRLLEARGRVTIDLV